MRVDAVDSHYFTRVPGVMASPTVTTWRLGGSPAASSIPCEVMPRSGRGARLATTTIRFPTSAAGIRVGLGDAGHDGARLRLAHVDRELEQLVGLGHRRRRSGSAPIRSSTLAKSSYWMTPKTGGAAGALAAALPAPSFGLGDSRHLAAGAARRGLGRPGDQLLHLLRLEPGDLRRLADDAQRRPSNGS